MDITLEKIDMIKERTGVSYKEAKEALVFADGNVVDAIINIEEKSNKNWTEDFSVKGNEAMEKIKEIIKTGNVNRIKIKKDDTIILDIPITAGALSAVILPQITAIGTAIALMTKCTIEVERSNKEVLNVGETITKTADKFAEKVMDAANDLKNKGEEVMNNMDNKMNDQSYNAKDDEI